MLDAIRGRAQYPCNGGFLIIADMSDNQPLPHECTVMFADLVGSTQLYERVGDSSAFRMVDRCLKEMQRSVEQKQGRVVKHTGDGLMVVFSTPNHAADAALTLHTLLKELSHPAGQRLAVRIGFHHGPVIESGSDVFGETVNFAARLVELASPGRAITTGETRNKLSGDWQGSLSALQPRVLRGASRPFELYELQCESVGEITILQVGQFKDDEDHELHLFLGDQKLVLNAGRPIVRLGREPSCELRVGDSRASRRHGEIELRGDKFVLVDRSSNGTFVWIDGEREFLLSREEAVLRGQGHIALGGSCIGNPFAISFICF